MFIAHERRTVVNSSGEMAEKDFAGSECVAVNGQDLEQSCRDHDPAAAAEGVSRGLAIGLFVREVQFP
jgi:hypothetical protein